MEAIIPAFLNALSYIIVAALGLLSGKNIVGPNQEKLVSTLKDLIEVQERKIQVLEEEGRMRDNKIRDLEFQVAELKALTIFQAAEIQKLTNVRFQQ